MLPDESVWPMIVMDWSLSVSDFRAMANSTSTGLDSNLMAAESTSNRIRRFTKAFGSLSVTVFWVMTSLPCLRSTTVIDRVLAENPLVIEEVKKGKNKALGFFVGQVMKLTSGKANPALVNKILKKKLYIF